MAYPISNVYRRVQYSGSAGTGPYSFSFEILSNTDVSVYKNQTLLTLTTDYTVTINANGTGSITLVSAATGSDTITIYGARAVERTSDFVTGGDLFANTLNNELDSLVIFTQQNKEEISRSLMAPVTDPTTIDLTLPKKTDRAGYVLSFNSSTGNPEVTTTVGQINMAKTYASNALTSQNAAAASAAAALVSQGAAATSASASAASASAAAASVNGGMYSAVQDKSANYTVDVGDAGDLIRVTTTSGNVTITLPVIDGTTITDGFKVAIVKWTNDSNTVSIVRSGSNTINGLNIYSIGSQYTSATFVADAETGQWFAAASGVGTSNIVCDVFNGTGSQTAFTLSGDPGSKNNTFVHVAGVYQNKSTYTQSGTTITFASAPAAGTGNIEVIWIQPQAIGVPSDGTVGIAKLSASGTPSSTSFLRGDNTWAVPPAGFSGATTNAVGSSSITLVYNSNQYQVAQINSYANSYVTLPDATTMLSIGSNPFVIENRSPIGANLELRNSAGTTVGYIPIGQIGLVQLKDKSTSAGQWVMQTTNPQVQFKYDANSITSATNSPVATTNSVYYFGIVGLSSTTFVRWWTTWTNNGTTTVTHTLYTQVGTISGSTITFGSTQSTTALSIVAASASGVFQNPYSQTKVMRLSNTAFVVMLGGNFMNWDGTTIYMRASTNVFVNTVSGNTVTFGTPNALSMPAYSLNTTTQFAGVNAVAATTYQGVMCRISDTAFSVFYNDAVIDTYANPLNFSGSLSCQVITVSGTTMTVGTKANLATSTYSVPFSCVALSATSLFVCYAQAASAGSNSGRTKLNVVSVSGTTATFNTSVTIEASDVTCFGTAAIPYDGAVAPSATQVIFNAGYFVGEATVSGTVPTYDSTPYSSQLFPLYLSTSSKAWSGGAHSSNIKAYLNITTGGFVISTGAVDVLQSNLSVTSAIAASPLGAQPTTSFVGYRTGQGFTNASSLIILGTTT